MLLLGSNYLESSLNGMTQYIINVGEGISNSSAVKWVHTKGLLMREHPEEKTLQLCALKKECFMK